MSRYGRWLLATLCLLMLAPAAAFAQASITGTVKDASGAVLPGVTVEASSPALIEKVRTATTDGSGQYRIVDLPPGTYTITFTLTGFSTVKRDGVELTGSFVASINSDLRVGAVEETITVSGEAPVVDVQTVTRERVLNREVIEAIPTANNHIALTVLIPGILASAATGGANQQDLGGTAGDNQSQFSIHGSRTNDQRFTVNGNTFAEGNGSTHALGLNVAAMQEVSIETGNNDATLGQGGVRINFIPRTGGNTFGGSMYYSATAQSLQTDNIDDKLKALGLPSVNPLKKLYDIAPTFGGPIARDKVWFFLSFRMMDSQNYLASKYHNVNAGTEAWTYVPDLGRQQWSDLYERWAGARFTWQANANNKISLAFDDNTRCQCPGASATNSYESSSRTKFMPLRYHTVEWSSPVTSRLLLDASFIDHPGHWGNRPSLDARSNLVQVTDNAPPASYLGVTTFRAGGTFNETDFPTKNFRTSMSYVTGAHSVNTGFTFTNGQNANLQYVHQPLSYTFTNGVPTQLTQTAYPRTVDGRLDAEIGVWVQERWTRNRLTVNGALRFDYFETSSAPITLGPTTYFPTRNLSFPEVDLLSWKDITPRIGFAYDVFGTGKTAVKISLNKYLQNQGATTNTAPSNLYVASASRSWTDGNKNFLPDCDLTNFGLQDNLASGGDLCGAFTGNNVNFGRTTPSTAVNRETEVGWGVRPYNWEFSAGVQHEVVPRVSVDVGYFRRWFGNFTVTDNRNVTAADFSPFSVTAPANALLPDGGSYTVSGFRNINPNVASAATDNIITFAKDFGTQTQKWNGVDFTVDARLRSGFILQGGSSTGKTVTDNCEILAKVPESSPLGVPYCHQDSGWLTQLKALGAYTIPRFDVQFSAALQNRPGVTIAANYVATNAQVQPSLGRPLSGNAANVTVNLIAPESFYGDRINQIDLRFAKILRLSRTRSTLSVDIYNATNANTVLIESNAYTTFRRPSSVMGGRLVKFTAQVNF